jgi:hypothetical protein
MTTIERLAVFPFIDLGDWVFRCSISNKTNIMILAFCKDTSMKHRMLMRFFSDAEIANAWVEECNAGKHIDD